MTLEPPPGHLCSLGILPPCKVCELDTNPTSAVYVPSERSWAFVPTDRELLTICLYCGNVIRERRAE